MANSPRVDPEFYRERAIQVWALMGRMTDPERKKFMLRVVEAYEDMARRAENRRKES
jgi:ABC-type ATPase with predicted acetyltransferase domain